MEERRERAEMVVGEGCGLQALLQEGHKPGEAGNLYIWKNQGSGYSPKASKKNAALRTP